VFKELHNFVEFIQKFEGINWKVYVRIMNRYRKIGSHFKPDDPNALGSIGVGMGGPEGFFPPPPRDPYYDEEE